MDRFAEHTRRRNTRLLKAKDEALAAKKAARQVAHHKLMETSRLAALERKQRLAKTNINKRFGIAIINKREVLGLTQAQLADVLEMECDFLDGLEDGSRGAYFDTAMRIISVLQIRLDYFVELQDVEPARRRLAAAIEAKAQEVEDQMLALRKQMDDLQAKQNLIRRVKNGSDLG